MKRTSRRSGILRPVSVAKCEREWEQRTVSCPLRLRAQVRLIPLLDLPSPSTDNLVPCEFRCSRLL